MNSTLTPSKNQAKRTEKSKQSLCLLANVSVGGPEALKVCALLSPVARKILNYYLFLGGQHRDIWATRVKVASFAGCHIDTVCRTERETLIPLGLITKWHKRKSYNVSYALVKLADFFKDKDFLELLKPYFSSLRYLSVLLLLSIGNHGNVNMSDKNINIKKDSSISYLSYTESLSCRTPKACKTRTEDVKNLKRECPKHLNDEIVLNFVSFINPTETLLIQLLRFNYRTIQKAADMVRRDWYSSRQMKDAGSILLHYCWNIAREDRSPINNAAVHYYHYRIKTGEPLVTQPLPVVLKTEDGRILQGIRASQYERDRANLNAIERKRIREYEAIIQKRKELEEKDREHKRVMDKLLNKQKAEKAERLTKSPKGADWIFQELYRRYPERRPKS